MPNLGINPFYNPSPILKMTETAKLEEVQCSGGITFTLPVPF